MKPKVKTKLPGPKSQIVINKLKKLNIGYGGAYPYVHNKKGSGCYFQDLDNNTFLDFACQIASNPLGYNHRELNKIVKQYHKHPIKYAGQDFAVTEHSDLLEELLGIVPKGLDMAFFVNSGAEAVENCMKLALRKQKQAKFGISFESGFHGRTMGALSATNSKAVQKANFLSLPIKRLPYSELALEKLDRLVKQESAPSEIGFIIMETLQGEGGYNVAPIDLVQGIRNFTKKHGIPFIADEVQSGMGRTGKWWSINHYNLSPDIMSSAKALQVGASIASKKFSVEEGSISSTWGGGHLLDLAIGLKTIQIIKKHNLLHNINLMGKYITNNLWDLKNENISNIRGRGLMLAFDLPNKNFRNNFIIECLKQGLVLLGCGSSGVRLIPPFIISKKEIDQALQIIESSLKAVAKSKFRHTGKICNYLTCGESTT